MKANKTHISLETAKLLKDCGVESELYFAENEGFVVEKHKIDKSQDWKDGYFYPAYTWQEILWENADKFFEEEPINELNDRADYGITERTEYILYLCILAKISCPQVNLFAGREI